MSVSSILSQGCQDENINQVEFEVDEIDKEILHRIKENEGENVRAIIRPMFLKKSESALRSRLAMLELRKLIRLKKTRSAVRCYIEQGVEV